LDLRQRHPRWGARKIRSLLKTEGKAQPGSSTITRFFIDTDRAQSSSQAQLAALRARIPNSLWQMDFKGPLSTQAGVPMH